jgi:Na+-driven multidrug efflux pump
MSFMLNIFFGLVANAARGIAVQVESNLQRFADSFMTAVRPQIVKSYAVQDFKGFFKLIFESSKYSFFLLFLVTLPVFLECDYILKIWLVNVPENTCIFLRWIMMTHVFRAMSRPVIDGCHATGNIKYLNLYTSFTILLTLPCSWLAFKMGYPPVSMFIIHGFFRCLCNFVELYVLKKEVSFRISEYLVHVVCRCLLVSVLVSTPPILVIFFLDASFARMCITIIVSMLSVGLGTYFFILQREYREKLIIMLRNRVFK